MWLRSPQCLGRNGLADVSGRSYWCLMTGFVCLWSYNSPKASSIRPPWLPQQFFGQPQIGCRKTFHEHVQSANPLRCFHMFFRNLILSVHSVHSRFKILQSHFQVAGSCLEGQWQLGSWLLDEMTITHLLPDLMLEFDSTGGVDRTKSPTSPVCVFVYSCMFGAECLVHCYFRVTSLRIL